MPSLTWMELLLLSVISALSRVSGSIFNVPSAKVTQQSLGVFSFSVEPVVLLLGSECFGLLKIYH